MYSIRLLSCILITLIFHGHCLPVNNPNLALNKPAYQISTYDYADAYKYRSPGSYDAEIAVDGLIMDDYKFSHTNGSEPSSYLQWWMVDLQNEYDISEVSVYGRPYYGQRTNVNIYLCKQCPTNYEPQTGEYINFSYPMWENLTTLRSNVINQTVSLEPSRKTRFVALARYGFINILEVEIYQHPFTNTNIAYGKNAYQTGAYTDWDGTVWSADKAVDGILHGYEFAHTYGDGYPPYEGETLQQWWLVDLGGLYIVTEIYLHGRIDKPWRSTNITIYLRGEEITTVINVTNINFEDGEWKKVDTLASFDAVGVSQLSPPRQARYVAVWRMGFINLKEVKVYQRARVDLAQIGTKRCNGGVATEYAASNCEIKVNNYLEISWSKPILFEIAKIHVMDGRGSRSLGYNFTYEETPRGGFREVRLVGYSDYSHNSNRTLVLEDERTPVIRSMRIIVYYGGPVKVSEVNIYAADIPRENEVPKLLRASPHDLEIEFTPFRDIPYIYNAYPDTNRSQCQYVVYGAGLGQSNRSVLGQTTSFSAGGLFLGEEYTFELSCIVDNIELPGPIKVITAKTRSCTAPEYFLGKDNIVIEKVNSTDRQSWKATVKVERLKTNCLSSATKEFSINGEGFKRSNIFNNLAGYSNYTFTARVTNSEGQTTKQSVQITTDQLDAPTISSAEANSSCVNLVLRPPSQASGKTLLYQVVCSDTSHSFSTTEDVLICGLKPSSKISCFARARHSVGSSPRSLEYLVYTDLEVPNGEELMAIGATTDDDGTPVVPLHIVQMDMFKNINLIFKSFLMIVTQRGSSSRNAPFVHLSHCLQISSNEEDCYTATQFSAAEMEMSNKVFNLGDGKVYNGFFNQVLGNEKEYDVIFAVQAVFPDGFEKLMPLSKLKVMKGNIPITTPLVPDHKLIAGVTAGTGLLLTVTIIITVIVLRKYKLLKDMKRENDYEQTQPRQEPEDHIYNSIELDGYERSLSPSRTEVDEDTYACIQQQGELKGEAEISAEAPTYGNTSSE